MGERIVLAYSGGLDTSVAVRWLKENYGYDVVALLIDLGEGRDLPALREKALRIGAVEARVVDAREEFVREYCMRALAANALYEGVYPLSAALSRPLIARWLVQVAEETGATAVAHGCTGKGNDQVRFDVAVAALNPALKVVAPVREWPMSREDEIRYAQRHGIPLPVDLDNPFSIDQNLWGRSVECGVLEDPWAAPPEEAFAWTVAPEDAPKGGADVVIAFREGLPVALDGEELPLVELVARLHRLAGAHGVGRIDHVENRLVGIKSREVYEAPAALALIQAHRALESLVLPRELAHAKPWVEQQYAQLIYNGLWFSPLREALDGFLAVTQRAVTGEVRLHLQAGAATVTGRRAERSLYSEALATYGAGDAFDHRAAEGFIHIWGLPTRVWAEAQRAAAVERR
ncbi:MAG: argininosuccinate synthase [Firmicutes bacterium]|nr:argininosuccinate synthase [Bacillota bacterium]